MKVHPDARIFPLMSEEEYERFADSIEDDGLLAPITLLDGAILDGRHRQRACEERGVEPRYVEWKSDGETTPLEWVIAVNLHRRQLTTPQRAALAAELEGRLAEAARQRMLAGREVEDPTAKLPEGASASQKRRQRESRRIAGDQFGVGESTVTKAKNVLQQNPETFAHLKAGDLTMAQALKLAGVPSTDPVKNKKKPQGRRDFALRDALIPLLAYLKDWDASYLSGVTPAQSRRLLKQVQKANSGLIDVEHELEGRTVVSRALR